MYEVNDYVRYGAKGVFQIKDIVQKKDKKGHRGSWYVLYSLKNGIETSVTTPSSNETIRKILNKKEIEGLINEIPSYENAWNENKTFRYQEFKEMIDSGSIKDLLKLAKSICLAKKDKEANGKQLAERDKEFLARAEELLFEEVSVNVSIEQDEVLNLMLSEIKEL